MKQYLIKKINKIDLEIYLWWINLEKEQQDNYKAAAAGILFIICFLIGAYFDNLTLQKINF